MVYAWVKHLIISERFLVTANTFELHPRHKLGRGCEEDWTMMRSDKKTKAGNLSFKKRRERDALDLAVLIYDIYKEKVNEGQTNANQVKKNTPRAQ